MSSRLSDLIRFAYNNPESREEVLSELFSGLDAEEIDSFERMSGARSLVNERGDCANPHVRGKPRPGYGTCYQTHNEYGSASSGENGSDDRKQYMVDYRKNNYDTENGPNDGKDRKTVPMPWGQSTTRSASSELVRLAHELPELRDPILKLFFFKTAVDNGYKAPSPKAKERGCGEVFKDRSELTQQEKIEMEAARKKGEAPPVGSCNRRINDYGSGVSFDMKKYMQDYRAKGFLEFNSDLGKEVQTSKGDASRSKVPDWAGKVKGENNPSKLEVQKKRTEKRKEVDPSKALKAPPKSEAPKKKKLKLVKDRS